MNIVIVAGKQGKGGVRERQCCDGEGEGEGTGRGREIVTVASLSMSVLLHLAWC